MSAPEKGEKPAGPANAAAEKTSKGKVALPSNWGENGEGEGAPPPEEGAPAAAPPVTEEREAWSSKFAYMLTLVGYAVGFGNIWRFPYLLHSNGGVAFLIPYTIMLALEGIPIFFLELAIGQRLRKGALGCWNEISPFLGGLGIAGGLTCYMVELYYNTLVAWVISYLFDSFRGDLAWTNCGITEKNVKRRYANEPLIKDHLNNTVSKECYDSPQSTQYYWYRQVLDISSGVTVPGRFNPWMFMCLIIGWLMVWGILVKGLKITEKVVYFTALFPYFTLTCFFIANFFQEGFAAGYRILLKPDFSVLSDPQVWLKAGTQIFFSLGVAYGCLIAFASHLPSNNNCYKDAVIVSIVNCATSIFASLVIFPVLGTMGTRIYNTCLGDRKFETLQILGILGDRDFRSLSEAEREIYGKNYSLYDFDREDEYGLITRLGRFDKNENRYQFTKLLYPILPVITGNCSLEELVRNSGSGTGLVFMSFAQSAVYLPCPQFWCFLFFIMLLTLGIDSSFGTTEGAIAAIEDLKILNWPRWAITSLVVGSLAFFSMIFAWGWGMYILNFIDQFVANWSLLIIAFFETVGIAWIYGLAQFSYDIKLMTGHKPNMFMMICWKFLSPTLLILILLMSIIKQFTDGYRSEAYNIKDAKMEEEKLPDGMVALGYILWFAIILWVPIQACLKAFGKSVLREETPAYFPEEELRLERNMSDDEDEDYNVVARAVMGKSIDDLRAYRETKRRGSDNRSVHSSGSTENAHKKGGENASKV